VPESVDEVELDLLEVVVEVVGVGVGVAELDGVVEVGCGVVLVLELVLVVDGGWLVDDFAVEVEDLAVVDEPPTSKTSMLATAPLGTVTTQKLAPPTPEAATELVTPPIPSVSGEIEHGSPLHPAEASQVILRP
jgi:hypothetical protein